MADSLETARDNSTKDCSEQRDQLLEKEHKKTAFRKIGGFLLICNGIAFSIEEMVFQERVSVTRNDFDPFLVLKEPF